MWRIAISGLCHQNVYRDQKVVFLDSIRATVKNVYHNGLKRKAGYFGPTTKPIFRSESARYILFIQMSKEMWEFDVEGGGEIMFNKVINGFLPELFKSWTSINARHLITIVMFSRVEYDDSESRYIPTRPDETSGSRADTRDFFRVVVSDVAATDWIKILGQLKREFRTFLRDITVQQSPMADGLLSTIGGGNPDSHPDFVIVGKPSTATKGNILEAINLALSQFSRDYIDRDLVRTGISMVVITAGSGIFDVDYSMLKLTTETLIGSGMGIDLVCLAPMPLHSVPLFKYRNPTIVSSSNMATMPHSTHTPTNPSSLENTPRQSDLSSMMSSRTTNRATSTESGGAPAPGDWSFAMPHWIDVSFWKGTGDEHAMDLLQKSPRRKKKNHHKQQIFSRPFSLRCVLYELEMMGFMENEMTNIGIALIHKNPHHPWEALRHRITGRPPVEFNTGEIAKLDHEWMNKHDEGVFLLPKKPTVANDPTHANEKAVGKHIRSASVGRKTPPKDAGIISESAVVAGRSVHHSSNAGYLGWNMKTSERPSPLHPQRKSSIVSFNSTADNSSIIFRTSGPTSRQLSVGQPSLAAPQADLSQVTASQSLSSLVSAPPMAKPKQTAAARYFDQVRAALTRTSSSIDPVKQDVGPQVVPEVLPLKRELPERIIPEVLAREPQTSPPSKPKEAGTTPARRTKPIFIDPSRKAMHNRSSSEDHIGSVETVKGRSPYPKSSSGPKSSRPENEGDILLVASSRRMGQKPVLSSSHEGTHIPQTLSPMRGIAPWLVLVNPSNPKKNNFNANSQFRRWQHVFPKRLKTSSMKWKSLSSPASVPLTNDYFPTAQQLKDEYHESTYKIAQNIDEEVSDGPRAREGLVRELIAFRLAHGFQLIVGSAVANYLGSQGHDVVDIFDSNYMVSDGATAFMSVGNTIHQLLCLAGGEVEIRRFRRKPTAEVELIDGYDALSYVPYIRTPMAASYEAREVSFRKPKAEYNWNYIDQFLAGYHEEFSESLRFWRARFVFIPVDIPAQNNRRHLPMVAEDSEEEIRLEGIRKLTHIWQRHRVWPAEERGFSSMRRRKDGNPLQIDYQTRDPSAVVAAGPVGLLVEGDSNQASGIFSETDTYSTDNIDLQKLAQDIQGEHGIRMLDRRWHFKLYYNCFLGFDLTSWLLERFRDIPTRDDAVELGNELMGKGLFQHVSKKHTFRDGNFFYHMSSEYRIPRADSKTGWFGGPRREKGSVPSTPMSDVPKPAYSAADGTRSRPSTSSSSEPDEKLGGSGGSGGGARRKVILSQVMRYNVDIKKQSFRPEIINIHYDRLHSPDNCYHFLIEWMNVTSKLIEDAISSWRMHGRKYGLKLVEVPIAEAASITETHSFRAPYRIELAAAPLHDGPAAASFEAGLAGGQHTGADRHAVHKALLKKLNFVLDAESASSFPSDVEVVHSWGRHEYRYTQYIHRSGTTMAQITDDGAFLLLANRLYNDRLYTREPSANASGGPHNLGGAPPVVRRPLVTSASPMSSPLVRPADQTADAERGARTVTAEEIVQEVERFCHDVKALQRFYELYDDEIRRPRPSPTPHLGPPASLSAVLEGPVPSLRLPPRVLAFRDGSGSPVGHGKDSGTGG
jgi:hypothetical protein